MAARQPAWKQPGSPIGKKGPRKANPKYKRRSRQSWSDKEVKQLRSLAKANTPTGVISLEMERPPASIASKAHGRVFLCGLRTGHRTIGARRQRGIGANAALIDLGPPDLRQVVRGHQCEHIHKAYRLRIGIPFLEPTPLGMILTHQADDETDLTVGINH